ncbi:MAG: HK97 gp10 family phage protein [Lachnospiraceae bacterium]
MAYRYSQVKGNINAGSLADAIVNSLEVYTEELEEDIQEAGKRIAQETAEELRQSSQQRSGDYAKGWKSKKRTKTKSGYVVYNETNYQLTHLLEKGHAKRNGGRTKAFKHIEPAEQHAIEKFEKAVEEAIKG